MPLTDQQEARLQEVVKEAKPLLLEMLKTMTPEQKKAVGDFIFWVYANLGAGYKRLLALASDAVLGTSLQKRFDDE